MTREMVNLQHLSNKQDQSTWEPIAHLPPSPQSVWQAASPTHPSSCSPTHSSIHLSIHPPIHPSTYPCTYPSIIQLKKKEEEERNRPRGEKCLAQNYIAGQQKSQAQNEKQNSSSDSPYRLHAMLLFMRVAASYLGRFTDVLPLYFLLPLCLFLLS